MTHLRFGSVSSVAVALATLPQIALAHHPLDGMTPQTAWHGFLSGIGHPVIGFDHLAFVIALGLVAAFHANRLLVPAGFVLATIFGTLLTVSAVALPMAEIVIALSVMGAGIAVMRGKLTAMLPAMCAGSAVGLFHGYAYGEAVIGAEATPLMAYLIGFGFIQFAIALGAGWAARTLLNAHQPQAVSARLTGAMIAGIGLFIVAEHVEGLVFSAL